MTPESRDWIKGKGVSSGAQFNSIEAILRFGPAA